MSTSQLSTFCKAVYRRQQPLSSQPKFLKAMFESAGASFAYGDDYGRSLANGSKSLTQDVRGTFPETIEVAKVAEFLRRYLTDTTGERSDLVTRCKKVAAVAGLPTSFTVDPDVLIPALADWFQAIIENPENSNILAIAYQRRLEGDDAPDLASFTPLYVGDEVIVTNPPSQQSHSAPFWGGLKHRWALQNTGTVAWSGRSLLCINPKVNGLRPKITRIPVPDIGPQGFVSVECDFCAHSFEGWSTSRWQMIDAEGNNCFPNHSSTFDVKADIVNPDLLRSEARQ